MGDSMLKKVIQVYEKTRRIIMSITKKRTMKRITALAMALALCFAMSAPAFAASLSGYNNKSVTTGSGSFTVNVSGSYSTAAGMTLKTTCADDGAFAYITITKPNGSVYKNSVYLGANAEKFFQMYFVDGGTYTVSYTVYAPKTMKIECWIYA